MFCEKCGHENTKDSIFCDNCGYNISANSTTADSKIIKSNSHNRKVLYIFFIILAICISALIFNNPSDNSDSTNKQLDNLNNEDWKEFDSIEGKFKISFPKFPTHETDNVDIDGITEQQKIELYTSEVSDDCVYLASYISYSDELYFSNAKTTLENSVNGSLQNIEDGKLVSSNFSKFLDYDVVNYLMHSPKDDIYVKGKNILVGNTLYSLLVSYRNMDISNIQFDKFFDSFQLTSIPDLQNNQNIQNQFNETDTTKADPVAKADYQEGYKSGYVDGRSSKGELGDNYYEPATEERKYDYLTGYLDGFLKGCKEGGFNCDEVEEAINKLGQDSSNNVKLIPSNVN